MWQAIQITTMASATDTSLPSVSEPVSPRAHSHDWVTTRVTAPGVPVSCAEKGHTQMSLSVGG